jgi:iron(III) transport system substrate-binding protein
MKSLVKLPRRGIVAGAIAVVALMGMPDTGLAQSYEGDLNERYALAKKEGKVVLYTVEAAELVQLLGEAFKKRFPGVDFDYYRGDSTQVSQRFEAETAAGRHAADAIMTTENYGELWAAKGWLAKHESPVAAIYLPNSQPADGLWVRFALNTMSFAWNTTLVKADEAPKTWSDLLDPKWKGKIGMQDPKSGGGGAHAWIARMYKDIGDEAKWHDFMDKMGKQIGTYGEYFPIRESLVAGEIAIQLAAYPDFTEPLKLKGAPVEWGTPDPTFFVALTMQVSRYAPRPNAAMLFTDFMLTEEAQKILADFGKIPALPNMRPGGFSRLNNAHLVALDLNNLWDVHPKEWFNEQIRKYFAPGR